MSPLSFLSAVLFSSCITLVIILIVYFLGTQSNRNIVSLLKAQIIKAFRDVISEFAEEQRDSATWSFKGTVQTGFPMQTLDIVLSLTRRHMILPLLAAKIWGANELVVIGGDFKRRARMNLEIIHRREQQVLTKYRQYLRTLDWVEVDNPQLVETFLLKTNHLDHANATLRFKELQQALLDAAPFLYWGSIETESPQLRIAFRLKPTFTMKGAAKVTILLVHRYDQVLRKAETRRS